MEVFDAIFRWSDSGGIYLYDQTSVKSRSAGLISYHGNIFVRPSHTFQKIMATSTETNLFQLSQEWGDASISSTFTVGNLMQCTRIFGLSVDVRPSTFVGVSGHQSIYYWLVVWNMFYIVVFFFLHMLRISSSQLTHIFQRGRWLNHQPDRPRLRGLII